MDQPAEAPPPGGITVEQPHLLLVEGSSDLRFWRSLLRERGRSDIQVEQTGSKDNLRLILPQLAKQRGFRSQVKWVGIIQDANTDPRAAFDRICGALQLAKLPVPIQAWSPTQTHPAVAAFVLPDEDSNGDFETLLWRDLVSQPAAECVDAYIRCLVERNLAPRQESKARVYAYLASLARPDQQLSIAVLRNEVNGPGLQRLLNLLPAP